MSAQPSSELDISRDRELERIVSLQQASRLMGISADTIRRRHADKILRLSPRRQGMRLRDALLKSKD
jgi:hypothetical protein